MPLGNGLVVTNTGMSGGRSKTLIVNELVNLPYTFVVTIVRLFKPRFVGVPVNRPLFALRVSQGGIEPEKTTRGSPVAARVKE